MNESSNQVGTMQLLGMVAGLLVAPAITPALIWATIAADLPLTLVMVQLVVMALISKLLLRKLFGVHRPVDDVYGNPAMSNPWSSEPSNG